MNIYTTEKLSCGKYAILNARGHRVGVLEGGNGVYLMIAYQTAMGYYKSKPEAIRKLASLNYESDLVAQ